MAGNVDNETGEIGEDEEEVEVLSRSEKSLSGLRIPISWMRSESRVTTTRRPVMAKSVSSLSNQISVNVARARRRDHGDIDEGVGHRGIGRLSEATVSDC